MDDNNPLQWRGCEMVDRDGDKVGTIAEIYLDADTRQPEWAIVKTGLFGRSGTFVPLEGADREGDLVRVRYDKDVIKDAPHADADGELSIEEEQRLYSHYGLDDSREQPGPGPAPDAEQGMGTTSAGAGGAGMAEGTSSAEQAGGAQGEPPRRVRLVKYVVEEEVAVDQEGENR